MGRRRLAAADIGSNAARLLICDAENGRLEKVMAVRIPLRLGGPVFSGGKIGEDAGSRFVECMRGFRWLCRSQGVLEVRARATSAMREAADGEKWARLGGDALGAEVRMIDGREEAGLLAKSVGGKKGAHGILVDVGGGSADACVFCQGEALEAESFGLGAVRGLAGAILDSEWVRFREWVGAMAARYSVSELTACGGNIRRLGKILGESGRIAASELKKLGGELEELTTTERMSRYGLRLDRADVIVPAAKTYCAALQAGDFATLRIPKNAGLTDGMMREMAGGS